MAIVFGRACESGACADPCCPPPHVTLGNTAYGNVGVYTGFAAALAGTGLTGATWTSTTIPAGMSLNSSTGYISGTPTTADVYNIYVTVTTACGSEEFNCLFFVSTCTGGCNLLPSISEVESTDEDGVCIDTTYDVTGDFACPTTVVLSWSSGGEGMAITIYANGVSIYSEACDTTFADSASIVIPGGTTSIRVYVDCGCGGTGDPGGVFEVNIECP